MYVDRGQLKAPARQVVAEPLRDDKRGPAGQDGLVCPPGREVQGLGLR